MQHKKWAVTFGKTEKVLKTIKTASNADKNANETVIRKKSLRILILIGLFLSPFTRLDVPLYASRLVKRRFLLKSAYPLKEAVSNLHLRQPLTLNVLNVENYKLLHCGYYAHGDKETADHNINYRYGNACRGKSGTAEFSGFNVFFPRNGKYQANYAAGDCQGDNSAKGYDKAG